VKTTPPVHVRFVCFQLVSGQRQRLGLFQALDEARDCEFSPDWALKEIGEIESWFEKHLATPTRFERGRRIFSRGRRDGAGQPALSWFKPEAGEHIRTMHKLKLALEACGVHVEAVTTRNPGHVIYEDEQQVVAEPGGRRF
jgi:hypothetical protein